MAAPQAALDLIERFERNLEAYRSEHEQTALQRQIDTTDRQIDKLLYGLGVYPAEPRHMAGDRGKLGEDSPPSAVWRISPPF